MVTVMTDLIAAHERHIRAGGYAPATTVAARVRLLRVLDRQLPMGLEQSTTEELADFLANEAFAPWTRYCYYGHIRMFFSWATAGPDPLLDYDPTAGLIRPRQPHGIPRPATDDQVQHALAAAIDPWLLYIRLAAYAGMRAGEVAGRGGRTSGPT